MTEQILRYQTRSFDGLHSRILELVELVSFGEVSKAIRLSCEGRIEISWYAAPDRHITWIVGLCSLFLLVESPVLAVGEEIGLSVETGEEIGRRFGLIRFDSI